MKILYIHQYFSTPEGASGTRSYELGRRLVKDGHEVTLLCGRSALTHVGGGVSPAGRGDGVQIIEGMKIRQLAISVSNRDGFARRIAGFLGFSLASCWYALREDYDLIYCTSTPLTTALPGLVARHLRGKRFIFEVRDLWPELPVAMGIIINPFAIRLLQWFEKRTYRSADACVGLAPGIVEAIRLVKESSRVAEIPNACDFDLFQPVSQKHLKIANDSGWRFTALFCGAHGRANGLDAIIQAAAELKKRGRGDIGILLVGDGQYKAALRQKAEEWGLTNCVFLDPVPKRELAVLMANCDVGLMVLADVPAFQYGTSPNKFFDYIASGLPVLVNYPGWLADLLKEWKAGESVAPGNPEAFADALIRMADSPEHTSDMGKNAREMAQKKFSRDQLYERLKTLLGQDHPASVR